MRRAAVIHYKATTRTTSLADVYRKLGDTWHLHYCTDRRCRLVYECHGCPDASTNKRCQTCRNHRRPIWVIARDPHPCCRGNCALVTDKDQLIRYRLAGPGPWFQCKTCARCHGWPLTEPERKP